MHSNSQADADAEAGGVGHGHHPLQLVPGGELAQRRRELRQEECRVGGERVRTSRCDIDLGGLAARTRRAPDRVVGPPPLDGVNEAPALLEGAPGGLELQPLATEYAGGVKEAKVDDVGARTLEASRDTVLSCTALCTRSGASCAVADLASAVIGEQ